MSEHPYTPDEFNVRMEWVANGIGTEDNLHAEFDRWLAKVKAEALRQAAYVAGDVAPDGMGGNDWFPSEWADYVAGWLEYRAARIENGAGQ